MLHKLFDKLSKPRWQEIALLGVIAFLVAVDQGSKQIAVWALSDGKTIQFLPGFLHFQLTYNTGGAFGILQGQQALFLIVTSVVLLSCIVLLMGHFFHGKWIIFGLVMVISGGVGNLIDRALFGKVVDFFQFGFFDFPIFNVADILVVCGMILLIAVQVFEPFFQRKPKHNEKIEESKE